MAASRSSWRRVWQQLTRPALSSEERSIRFLYWDIGWFGIVNGIAGTFTSVFAVRLGASNELAGLLVSLPALVAIVGQLAAGRLVEREQRQMRLIVWSVLLTRLGYLAIALVPWLVSTWRPEAVVAVVTLMAIPSTVANLSLNTMMADVVSPKRRAHVVSTRYLIIYLTTTATVLLTGRLLDLFAFPGNYQGAFFIAFLASLLSLAAVARVRIPGDGATRPGAAHSPVPWRTVITDLRFRRFAIATFIVNVGIFAPSALYTLFRVRTLGASNTWIGILGTIETAIAALASYFWGRQAARRGSQRVLLLSALGLTFYPLLMALTPSVEPLAFVTVIGGAFAPAYNIAIFNLLLEACPEQGRPAYMAVYTLLLNVATFAAPLAGTAVADWLDIRTALLLTSAVRLAGAGAVIWWMGGRPWPARAASPRAS